jgi:hypothetical protein
VVTAVEPRRYSRELAGPLVEGVAHEVDSVVDIRIAAERTATGPCARATAASWAVPHAKARPPLRKRIEKGGASVVRAIQRRGWHPQQHEQSPDIRSTGPN